MAKKDRSNFSFSGKVIANAEKIKRDQSFAYMILPKDTEVYTPDPGTIKFDVIPYIVTSENHPDRDDDLQMALPGDPWYKRPFYVHRNIGVDSETVLCLQSIGEKCPVCEQYAIMKSQGADEDDLKAIAQKARNLYWIVPLGSRKWDEVIHLKDISHFLLQDLLLDELKENPEHEAFAHPIEGETLQVRYEKNSFGGRTFAKAGRIDFKPRNHEYDWDLVEDMYSLDKLIEDNVLTYAELEKLFMSMLSDDYTSGEQFSEVPADEKPPTGRKAKSPLTRKKKEPEQEEQSEQKEEPVKEKKSPMSRTKKNLSPGAAKTNSPFKKKPGKGDEATDNECPYGHEFGVDTDSFNDCEKCDLWDSCNEAKNNSA